VRPFDGRRILLGVTGGIASYKSAWLARLLTQAGAQVDVVLTRSAREFIGSVTFEALTGRPVTLVLIGDGHALDHIRLAREAELMVIAPATADFLARAAHGHADELLSAALLAAECPVLVVPAMNDKMWANAQVQANCAALAAQGKHVLEPGVGRSPRPTKEPGRGGCRSLRRSLRTARGCWRRRAKLAGGESWSRPAPPARHSIRCAI
jgi:phosphopantothenoylcysteine decarboxylase / phosphopantothenate---cysteine ligase